MTSENTAWESFCSSHAVGDLVDVNVEKVVPFGAIVSTASGVPGLLSGTTGLSSGDAVSARIDALDTERQRISLVGV